jgi:hypothetical protein
LLQITIFAQRRLSRALKSQGSDDDIFAQMAAMKIFSVHLPKEGISGQSGSGNPANNDFGLYNDYLASPEPIKGKKGMEEIAYDHSSSHPNLRGSTRLTLILLHLYFIASMLILDCLGNIFFPSRFTEVC